MRRKNERFTDDADRVVKDIKRQTRRRFAVLANGLRQTRCGSKAFIPLGHQFRYGHPRCFHDRTATKTQCGREIARRSNDYHRSPWWQLSIAGL